MAQQKQDFQRQPRRKYCQFCKEETEFIDYKDLSFFVRYATDRGELSLVASLALARSTSTTLRAIKRAREMALLPLHCPCGFPAAVAVVADNLSVL